MAAKRAAKSGGADHARRRLGRGAASGAIAALLAAALWLPGILDRFEATTFDVRARLFAKPETASSEVFTILLDQYSLTFLEDNWGVNWPWPRSLYAQIADFCARGGAKALVLDMLFTEETNEYAAQDEALREGLAANGRIVAAVNLATNSGQGSAQAWPAGATTPSPSVAGLGSWSPRGLDYSYAEFPIPAVLESAAILANTNLPPDPSDGVYRREPFFARFGGRVVPSEALAAWLVGQGPAAGPISIERGSLKVGSTRIPIDAEGRAILRWRGPSLSHANQNAAAILNSEAQVLAGQKPDFDPAALKGKYVFFGVTAPGLLDLKPTPMGGTYPGVELNATMLDNLLAGDFLSPTPTALTLVALLILSLAAALAVSSVSGGWRSLLVFALFLALAFAPGIVAYPLGAWFPIVPLVFGTVFALLGATLSNFLTEGRQKRMIKGMFGQYLSPTLTDILIENPALATLGSEKRELTMYFSDLQGFTTFSSKLSPERLSALLNEYLTAMTDIIEAEGGYIDKYEGDAIIAFWNAPVPFADHAARGLRAALRCQQRLAELRPGFEERYGSRLLQRIGMNTGAVNVGNFGSKAHIAYTMIGDHVNLAARLEGVNKQFGTYTLVSEAVIAASGGAFPARELSRVAVVGRAEPVRVFEPMLPEEHASRKEALEGFAAGLKLFYAGDFKGATAAFAATAASDPPSAAYLRKCEELAADPAASRDWKGVWVMTEK
jgi:adenylate cyclase